MSKEEQKKDAMDQLFKGLTTPSVSSESKNEQQKSSAAVQNKPPKKYDEENERVCTIMKIEIMNKLRYIAGKEGVPIRDLFGIGARMIINAYEKDHGEIRVRKSRPKKGDASKLFNV